MREHTPTERTPPLPRPCAPPDRCRAVLPCLRTEPPSDPHQRRFLRGAESIPTPSISPPLDRQRAIPQGRIGESVYDSRPSDEKRRRRLGSLPTCRASPPRPHDPSSAAQVSGPRGRAPAAAQPPPCLHESQSCLWSGPSGGPAVLRCGACPAISTPSLPAQGEQRRSSNFNIRRGNPDQFSRSPYFSNLFRSAAGSLQIATRRCFAWPRCRPGPPNLPEAVDRRICPRRFHTVGQSFV
jgi:hypothetical protein